MGAYKYIAALWQKKQSDVMRYLFRIRTWEYRQLPPVVRVREPTRVDKAHRLGYKKLPGISVFRVRVVRGDRRRIAKKGIVYGKPRNHGIFKQKSKMSLRWRAETYAGKKAPGLRIVNSYWIGQDGRFKYYEIIMYDPFAKRIRNDSKLNWICANKMKHRETRGMTPAGKKCRGLKLKKKSTMSLRPTVKAAWRRNRRISLRRFR